MRRLLCCIALPVAAAAAACDDHEPAAPSLFDVADIYGFSSLRMVMDGDTTDITGTASGPIVLAPDSSLSAILLVDDLIETGDGLTVHIKGAWSLRGSTVTLTGLPVTFMTGLELRYRDGRLTGVADVDTARLLIELDSEDELDDGDV